MIRFCDKEVYNIVDGDFTRSQLIMFFLQEKVRKFAVIAVYHKDGSFKGIITYRDLIEYEELEKSINEDIIEVTDNFWEEAKTYFQRKSRKLLTVVDKNGNILGFAYNDSHQRYNMLFNILAALETTKIVMPASYNRVQTVVITDLNELAWRCFKLFDKNGFSICVFGEKWEWFGLKCGEGYNFYPDYSKLYIYAEGTKCLREEIEWGQSYYDDVYESFCFIHEIGVAVGKLSYKEEIKRLVQSGITVCECCIPVDNEIQNKTLYEELSIAYGIDIANYIKNPKKFTNVQKECLWHIYGKEKIDVYKKAGNDRKIELVPMGNIQGRTLKGIRYNKYIYLLGPCIVRGYGCLEHDTLYAQLQKYVIEFGYQVIAVNIPYGRFDVWRECFHNLPIREKDIILSLNSSVWFADKEPDCYRMDLKLVYEKDGRKSIFCGEPLHTNSEGNRLIAEEIIKQFLIEKIADMDEKRSNRFIQRGEILNKDGIVEIEDYVNNIKIKGGGKNGAIVMNCNPFTKGHRYLIEYAAGKVDNLYVFVVEEDRSYFKFKDRLKMVQEGTIDIPNVVVVPSGNWVLSYKTMPVYFEKEEMQELQIDAKLDLEIFARYIAPKLDIIKRFVGEEPIDKVTRQYNEQMQEILTLFDIEYEEIPRMRINNNVISASRVRECIIEGKWEEVSTLIPKSTYKICKEGNYFKKK